MFVAYAFIRHILIHLVLEGKKSRNTDIVLANIYIYISNSGSVRLWNSLDFYRGSRWSASKIVKVLLVAFHVNNNIPSSKQKESCDCLSWIHFICAEKRPTFSNVESCTCRIIHEPIPKFLLQVRDSLLEKV